MFIDLGSVWKHGNRLRWILNRTSLIWVKMIFMTWNILVPSMPSEIHTIRKLVAFMKMMFYIVICLWINNSILHMIFFSWNAFTWDEYWLEWARKLWVSTVIWFFNMSYILANNYSFLKLVVMPCLNICGIFNLFVISFLNYLES